VRRTLDPEGLAEYARKKYPLSPGGLPIYWFGKLYDREDEWVITLAIRHHEGDSPGTYGSYRYIPYRVVKGLNFNTEALRWWVDVWFNSFSWPSWA
jgi:hypothetical protein